MNFISNETKGKVASRKDICGCEPGEVYEFVCQNEDGQESTVAAEALRLCISLNGEKHMIGLLNGRSRNSSRGISDDDRLYIPRPDIKLVLEK